jgi:hypothetical protein
VTIDDDDVETSLKRLREWLREWETGNIDDQKYFEPPMGKRFLELRTPWLATILTDLYLWGPTSNFHIPDSYLLTDELTGKVQADLVGITVSLGEANVALTFAHHNIVTKIKGILPASLNFTAIKFSSLHLPLNKNHRGSLLGQVINSCIWSAQAAREEHHVCVAQT